MKRIFVLTALILTLCLAITGCASAFDWNKAVDQLTDSGLTVSQMYTTQEELADATALINSEIQFMGGEFTAEIKRVTILIEVGDTSMNCQLFEFATEEQAKNYVDLYVSTREEGSQWKIAHTGAVVALTNIAEAQQVLKLSFR